ncbi:hypothetical protein HZY97_02905 [Sphingomonas sp. R-74633]|uniref:hypothetical protein n=1 Tax=Sphingomonas sp. R-74633 TaxID=2751188 RepID=UPI0015D198C5|nr:hypothetical protein [Sphingomonas sp. R-74633]NYT39694.1 hypothetical protein [Sphingomonas sp. R-74633]
MQMRTRYGWVRQGLSGAGCAAALLVLPGVAHGQTLDDKYWIEISGYWPDVDSKVQVANVAHPNIATEIDLESDLDLSDRKVLPAVNAGVRLGHFVLAAEYYSLRRSNSHAIERDLTFDDVTYPVGATVSSEFNSDIYRFTVGYDIVKQENVEFGLALGAHVTNFEVGLSGQATVSGSPVLTTEARKKSVLAPLPTLGAYGAVKLVPRLMLSGRVDWLSVKIDDYKGRLWNVQAEINYRIFKNVGIGVMYRYVDYRLDADKEKWTGSMTYRFSGPAAVLRIGFK